MAQRFYLVPQVWMTPAWRPWASWRPKYIGDVAGLSWSARNYGHQGYMLVSGDFPQSVHNALAGASDAFVIPQNLNQQIGPNLLTVQDALEAMNFPADWVNASMTYRRVLRLVWAAIQLFMDLAGILHNTSAPFIAGAVTLQTEFRNLPAAGRTALLAVRDKRGIDDSALSNTSTLRQIIKVYADQVPARPFRGVTF